MKWTKFKQEFDPGEPLHRLLQKGDKLIKDPGTPVHPPQKNIWVSQNHDPLIDSCFRIYTDPGALNDDMYDGTDPDKRQACYHPWQYFKNVPEKYLDPLYANLQSVALVHKIDPKVVHSLTNYGGGPLPLGGDRPHPYEVFCGGWVHFYDVEIRHGETDHAIYFLWDHWNRDVTVYIYQTKPILNWNVYVKVNPPTSQDPPTTKAPPPYC